MNLQPQVYIRDTDLKVGEIVDIYNRKVFLYGCDEFTRHFYRYFALPAIRSDLRMLSHAPDAVSHALRFHEHHPRSPITSSFLFFFAVSELCRAGPRTAWSSPPTVRRQRS